MDLSAIQALIDDDRRAVDAEIGRRLHSEVALVNQVGAYIIHSGGKRLRPLIVLLAARAVGYQGRQHVSLAAIIEFIHTATLLHDDVVDDSPLRRGRETANAVWGNEASVLVGDFLYSRAFEMMVEIDNMRVMGILAKTTNTIAEGEVLQLLNCHDPDVSEARYLHVIHSKTAKLFEAAAQLGAVIGGQPVAVEAALAGYGRHLGTAFQLTDDLLDYSADSQALGKNVGADLAEGKPTLPLIHALRTGSEAERRALRAAIESGGREHIETVLAAIESTGANTYTARKAEDEASSARQALAVIPDSPYKQALLDLADFSAHRNH
ncbi:MAG: octaprenyl diphosphate synthase [Gammaproteobacteria bacterium]|nr:octaprenyl diphosphate synthase [Gammaproteobacteria bacterium]